MVVVLVNCVGCGFWVRSRYAKEVCDAIVAKCLTGRPKTVEKAQMVFLLWVELEAVESFLVCVNQQCCAFLKCLLCTQQLLLFKSSTF